MYHRLREIGEASFWARKCKQAILCGSFFYVYYYIQLCTFEYF